MDYPSTPIEEWHEETCLKLFDDLVVAHPKKLPPKVRRDVRLGVITAKFAILRLRGAVKAKARLEELERQQHPSEIIVKKVFSIDELIKVASQVCDTYPEMIKTTLRTPRIVNARWFIAYVAHEYYNLSYPQIGRGVSRTGNHSGMIVGSHQIMFGMDHSVTYPAFIDGEKRPATGKEIVDEILKLMGYQATGKAAGFQAWIEGRAK